MWVYGIQSLDLIKVGISANIGQRLNMMRLSNPHGLKIVFRRRYRDAWDARWIEQHMHKLLAPQARGREWFAVTLAQVREAAAAASESLAADERVRFPKEDRPARRRETATAEQSRYEVVMQRLRRAGKAEKEAEMSRRPTRTPAAGAAVPRAFAPTPPPTPAARYATG